MTGQAPAPTRYDLEAKIVKRCWQDEAFRKEFTADPIATAVRYLQVPAESLPKIVIHEEPAGSWHIVLPEKPANLGELSEEDLEKIAGGSTPACIVTAVSVFTTVSAFGALTVSGAVTQDACGW